MSATPLSTRSLLDLLDLFEESNSSISDGEGHRLDGVPGWDVFGRTHLSARELAEWTECIGFAGAYPAPRGDERISVDLQEDSGSRYSYRCPETFRKKYVEASAASVYAVSPSKILNQIANLLEIPLALRRGIDSPAIDGVLWKLGEARVGPALTPIWLARGLAGHVEQVFQHFMPTTLPEQGVILTTGQVLPTFVRPPRNYRVASLCDVLIDYSPKPCLDMTMLERILTAAADGVQPRALPVEYNEATKVLTIRTKRDPWVIKGKRQASVVNYMYQQACKGRRLLDVSEILAAAYPEKATEESRTGLKIQDIFKGNDKWSAYISNPEWGKYAFNLD